MLSHRGGILTMSQLLAVVADVSQWLAPLVGTSVFGLTASIGGLLTEKDVQRGRKRRRSVPATAPARDPLEHACGFGNRRQLFRSYGTPLKVVVANADLEEMATGWVVDRSSGGLGIELDLPLPAGTILNLRPENSPGMRVWVEGMVRNCRDLMDCWKVGCQFRQKPPAGVLRLFG
jgi:hypothetical protein